MARPTRNSAGASFCDLAGAALLALLLISPLLYDQLQLAALRGGGSPFAVAPYDVLDRPARPACIGFVANLPAYWLVFLVVEFPAFYLAGVVAVVVLLWRAARRRSAIRSCVPLRCCWRSSLCVAWLLVSTLGDNNDLGWRAVLPGVLLLIVFAAVALSRWLERPVSLAAIPALALVLLGAARRARC